MLVPAFWALCLPWVTARATLLDATPFIGKFGNDEVDYWMQVRAWVRAGFGSGQFGWEELPAPAGWTHFGPHGPIYHAGMGLVGRAFGWSYVTPILVNVALVLLGMLALVVAARPSTRTSVLLVAVTLGFWPAWDNLVSAMQEPLHVAVALAGAGLLVRMLRNRRHWRALVALLVVASTMRVTWSLVLVAVILLALPPSRRTWRTVPLVLLVPVPFALLFGALAAPYPYNPTSTAGSAHGVAASLALLWDNVGANVASFGFDTASPAIDLVFRYQVAALVVLVQVVVTMRTWRVLRRRGNRPEERSRTTDEDILLLAWWSIVVLFVMTLVLYQFTNMRGFRVLGPHVLLVLVVAAIEGRTRLVRGLVACAAIAGVLTAPLGVHHYADFTGVRFDPPPAAVARLGSDLSVIGYQRHADSRWCNTILWRSRVSQFPEAFAGLPAGLGVTVDRRFTLDPPFRSRWLVSSPGDVRATGDEDRFRRIGSTQFGELYENLDADCDEVS